MRFDRNGVVLRRLGGFAVAIGLALAGCPNHAVAQNAQAEAATAAQAANAVKAAAAAAAPVDDSVILPFIDEGTFVIARLDIDRVDRDAMGTYASKSLEAMLLQVPAEFRAQAQGQMMQQVESAKQWLKDVSEAGVKHVYVLLDTADLGEGDGDGPVAIVPLTKEMDTDRVKALMGGTANGGDAKPEEVGNAIVMAEAGVITRIKKRFEPGVAPIARPDLAKAFAAGGDAPVRIALVPGESARKWVEDNLPNLPEEIGGGETNIVSRGVKYASLVVQQKPSTTASIAVHCENADKAKALLDTVNKGLATARKQLADKPQAAELTKKLNSYKPKLVGDTLSITIDPMDIESIGMGIANPQPVAQNGAAPAPAPAKKDDGGL